MRGSICSTLWVIDLNQGRSCYRHTEYLPLRENGGCQMSMLGELPVLGAVIAAGLFMAVLMVVSVEDALRR